MKKVGLIAAIGVLFVGMNSASAMTKDELMNKLTQSYTINGATYQLPADVAKEVDDYLEEFGISKSHADAVAEIVDEVVEALEAGDATSIEEFGATEKEIINDALYELWLRADIYAYLSDEGTLVVLNPETWDVFTEVGKDKIKQTGSSNLVLCAGVISLLGIGLALKKLNA